MFNRVNAKGEILDESLRVPVSPVEDSASSRVASTRNLVMRMREPPTADAWDDIRAVFGLLCDQVDALGAELGDIKKESARQRMMDDSRAAAAPPPSSSSPGAAAGALALLSGGRRTSGVSASPRLGDRVAAMQRPSGKRQFDPAMSAPSSAAAVAVVDGCGGTIAVPLAVARTPVSSGGVAGGGSGGRSDLGALPLQRGVSVSSPPLLQAPPPPPPPGVQGSHKW